MGMNDLTDEEFWQLDWRMQQFYLEQREFVDFRFHNGQLCVVTHTPPLISWETFHKWYKELAFAEYDRTDSPANYITANTDLFDWNPYGRPYVMHGFEFRLSLNVHSEEHSKEAKKAQKQVLEEWLVEHGATEDELKGISWNGHGYSADFRCLFNEAPHEVLPAKVKRWAKKNPEFNSCIFKKEA